MTSPPRQIMATMGICVLSARECDSVLLKEYLTQRLPKRDITWQTKKYHVVFVYTPKVPRVQHIRPLLQMATKYAAKPALAFLIVRGVTTSPKELCAEPMKQQIQKDLHLKSLQDYIGVSRGGILRKKTRLTFQVLTCDIQLNQRQMVYIRQSLSTLNKSPASVYCCSFLHCLEIAMDLSPVTDLASSVTIFSGTNFVDENR